MLPRYENLDFFLLRAPALPASTFVDLLSDNDVGRTRDRIRALASAPEVRRALYVASPDLAAALEKTPNNPTGNRADRMYSRVLRYLTRMSTRPTPFGAFSGIALGEFAETTTARLGPAALGGARVRADMSFLLGLIKELETDPGLRSQLRVVLNSSIYLDGDRAVLPYADIYGTQDKRAVRVRATPAVLAAMRLTATPVPYERLVDELAAEFPDAPDDRITGLIGQLSELNILTSDLRPPLTMGSPEQHLLKRLVDSPAAAPVAEALRETVEVSRRTDLAGLNKLEGLHRMLVPGHTGQTYQLDSVLDLRDPHITAEVGREVAGAVDVLMRLSAAVPGHNYHLAQYRHEFEERYGDSLVPVLEVLSPETGLDAPPTYTEPPRTHPLPPSDHVPDSAETDRVLTELAAEAWWRGNREVELTDAWLARLAPPEQAPPLGLYPALDAYAQLQVRGQIENGDWRIVLREDVIAYGGRTYGRFFDLFDESTVDRLHGYAKREEALFPDVVYAELSYLPTVGRAANVMLHPRVREYEIPLNTAPSVTSNFVITLDDLLVGAGEDRLFLWSKRLDRQVVATQTHMLSPHVAPNVVRFLLEVSNDGYVMPSGFRWGSLDSMPFLPRVTRGRTVLRPAQWTLHEKMLVAQDTSRATALAQWRDKWRVPRYVYLVDDDNRLLVDLEHPLGVSELEHELRRRAGRALLHEMLPAFGEQWLADESGRAHLDEIVVPLIVRDVAESARSPLPVTSVRHGTAAAPLHMPGEEWAFVSLYSAFTRHDEIIAESLTELARRLRDEDAADRWFYLRYADPRPHLRVRFRATNGRAAQYVLGEVLSWARTTVAARQAVEFSVDCYRPELHRYGGPAVFDAVEEFFAANSDVTAELVALLLADDSLDPEFVAVAAVDSLYRQFGLDLPARLALAPPGDDSAAARRTFREHRAYLTELLVPWDIRPDERGRAHHELLAPVLAGQTEAARAAAAAVDRAAVSGELSSGHASVLGSLAHMQINRLMPVDLEREGRCYTIWRHALRALGGRPDA
ncbi:lantibiotic dehydratase [Amycolatopsis sp. NPDC004079]|uniref:lantibiotic dehydratase n=1 Tax=Amycolatopsis sp. NPDC004079 TaxID=3154549 RepID=UPI0033A4A831